MLKRTGEEGKDVSNPTYLSDRLFVALAKRLGAPSKERLRPIREEQQRLLAEGLSISLFSLARWEGVLSPAAATRLLTLARQVAAREPAFRHDVIEPEPIRAAEAEPFEPWATCLDRLAPGPHLLGSGEPASLAEQGLELVEDDEGADMLELEPAPTSARLRPGAGDPFSREDWGDRRSSLGDSGVLLEAGVSSEWDVDSISAAEPLPERSPEPLEVAPRWEPHARDVLDFALESTASSFGALEAEPDLEASGPDRRAEQRARRRRRASRRARPVAASSSTFTAL